MRIVAVLSLFLAAAVVLAVWSLPADRVEAAPLVVKTQEVRSISLDGKRLPDAELRAALLTKIGDQLDAARLERDRAALEATLAARGYLAARVSPADVVFGPTGAAYVTFEIEQGRVFHLRGVTVSGAGKDAAVVTIASGDDAIGARLQQARQALSDALVRRGKPGRVELAVTPDEAAAAIDVELRTD